MAFFGASIVKISSIAPIPGADRLEVARLKNPDFEIVVKKGQFQVGDDAIYFPVDSVICPETLERIGLTGCLSGPGRDRLKTTNIRGQISQGLLVSIDLLPPDMAERNDRAEITGFLGIKKYESPVIEHKDCLLIDLPSELSTYEIDSADLKTDDIFNLYDEPVIVTEKIEGENSSVFCRKIGDDYQVCVNQHRKTVQPKPGSQQKPLLIRVAEEWIVDWARKLATEHNTYVAIYGEFIGPGCKRNIYKLPRHKIMIFDISIGGKWLDAVDFLAVCDRIAREMDCSVDEIRVPLIFEGKLRDFVGDRSVKEASSGQSAIANTLREGIVIKPVREKTDPYFGRVFFKQRSPAYLAKTDN